MDVCMWTFILYCLDVIGFGGGLNNRCGHSYLLSFYVIVNGSLEVFSRVLEVLDSVPTSNLLFNAVIELLGRKNVKDSKAYIEGRGVNGYSNIQIRFAFKSEFCGYLS